LEESEGEDAFGYDRLPDGTILLAVADGAGSAAHAKKGAHCVIQTAIASARSMIIQPSQPTDECFYHNVLTKVLQTVRTALETLVHDSTDVHECIPSPLEEPHVQLAEQPQLPLHEFATTLLLALVTPTWLAVLQVGDGAIVVKEADETIKTITRPDFKEYINECSFITDSDYQDCAQYSLLPLKDVQGIAMFTDGIQMLALELATNSAYAPFFAPLFSFALQGEKDEMELARELHDFLTSKRVCERTEDDKTLLLAVPFGACPR
jgi:hypothetical protein